MTTLEGVLTPEQSELLVENRRVLGDFRELLASSDASSDDLDAVREALHQLDDMFLLVVVGEFNAGKSAFVNALLGRDLQEMGVTPTTQRVHWLRYGDSVERCPEGEALEVTTAPIDLLRQIHLVDTPGTNAIDRRHETITSDFVPRADFVLFVTSADRPFTESERVFLERLRDWGNKIVVVVNKIDILEREEEAAEIEAFIRKSALDLLGIEPEIFLLSAKLATRYREEHGTKLTADPADGSALAAPDGGLSRLETSLRDRLDDDERVRLKLLNPLEVAAAVGRRVTESCQLQIELLGADVEALERLESQHSLYEEDMAREFEFRLKDVELRLEELENRGQEFFDETLRVTRIPDLLNRSRVEAQFEKQVVADTPRQIERAVDGVVDWLVEQEQRQWAAVTDYVAERQQDRASRMVGRPTALVGDRARLLETLGRSAQRAIETYDPAEESRRLGESVQKAMASAALLEVGAVGLGAAVALATTSTAVDITGILAAGTLATLGLFVLPNRRRRAKKALRQRLRELKTQLLDGLRSQFGVEIGRSTGRIREAVAPYTRFVRSERDALDLRRRDLSEALEALSILRERVQELGTGDGGH